MSKATYTFCASVVLSGLLSAACGGTPELEGEVEDAKQAITGGVLISDELFSVNLDFGAWTCSGTKIGANRFLTAGQCVRSIPVGAKVFISNSNSGFPIDSHTITAIHRYPTNPLDLSTGYSTDIAMFDVQQSSGHIEIWSTMRAPYVGTGLRAGWFNAYGCDNLGPNGGQRQMGQFQTTTSWNSAALAGYIHAEGDTSFTQICTGDNGGALFFNRNGTWELAGVGSFADSDGKSSFFARVGRVRNWIANPTTNVFASGSKGSLLNFKGNNCIKAGSGASTVLTYCDLRNIPADAQYWELEAQAGGAFRIKNTLNGRCLAAANGVLQHESCPESAGRNAWRFTTPATKNGFKYYQIRNHNQETLCIGTAGHSVANNVGLRTEVCSSSALDSQTYVFVP